MRSLKKSMAHYTEMTSTGDGGDGRSEASFGRESFRGKSTRVVNRKVVGPSAKMVSRAVIETLCFNIVLCMVYLIFVLYKGSLLDIVAKVMVEWKIIHDHN